MRSDERQRRRLKACVGSSESVRPRDRWRLRLAAELAHRPEYDRLTTGEWRALLRRRRVTSSNHDTVLSLDWPHYCGGATTGCGGESGWCYTFQGRQVGTLHDRHAAMVDSLARGHPEVFADAVASEVGRAVASGLLPYPNLRYSGSGEVASAHIPALKEVARREVRLWGFTRNLPLAEELRRIGASVIVSCDATSPEGFLEAALAGGFRIAYSSTGIEDPPPCDALVTFPVHRVGRVHEVVDHPSICPKVMEEFLYERRAAATCQNVCQRCHDVTRALLR